MGGVSGGQQGVTGKHKRVSSGGQQGVTEKHERGSFGAVFLT